MSSGRRKWDWRRKRRGWNSKLKQWVQLLQDMFPISLIQLHIIPLLLLHLCHHSRLQPTKVLQSPHHSLGWRCGTGCLRLWWTQLTTQSSGRQMLRRSYRVMLTHGAVPSIGGNWECLFGPWRKKVCNSVHVFAVLPLLTAVINSCHWRVMSVINMDLNPLVTNIPLRPCLASSSGSMICWSCFCLMFVFPSFTLSVSNFCVGSPSTRQSLWAHALRKNNVTS